MYIAGMDPSKVRTSTEGAEFSLGAIGVDHLGRTFVYVQADEAIGANEAVVIAEDFGVSQADTTSTAPGAGAGKPVGVSMAAIASGGFGWVCRCGTGSDVKVKVAASAAKFTRLNSTGTGGQLDDDGTSGAEVIEGLVISTTNGASAAAVQAVLNFPYVGATIS